jgi:glycosyltransferase involved in cell wall biosynthesis
MVPHYFSFSQKEIFIVHDLTMTIYPEYHNWQMILLNKFFFKKTLNNAYKILVPSESTKNDLVRYYSIKREKIFKIFIPPIEELNIREAKVMISINKPYILNLNTLEPRKNIISLIKAFEILKEIYKLPHQLLIVGKLGWKYKKILEKINTSKFRRDIILLGYVSSNLKKVLYKNASLLVYPSFYEGFGIPVLEAMYYGCPVVTSNTSSLPETVGDAGLMVNPYDIKGLADAIYKVIIDVSRREKMIKKGFIQAKKYTSRKNIKKKIESLVNFLLKN